MVTAGESLRSENTPFIPTENGEIDYLNGEKPQKCHRIDYLNPR
jgi:hypothetical protein